jgi:phosphoesterase RecJ-like protein
LSLSSIKQIGEILKLTSKKVVIISHVNPDGDAVGSVLGLYHFLNRLGFSSVTAILPSLFPSFLAWMPGTSDVLIGTNIKQKEAIEKLISNAKIIFCLDFNDIERVDNLSSLLSKATGKKILIDHHPDPTNEFDLKVSDVSVSSTSELIYNIINILKLSENIDKSSAECLYTGIITDTGSLSYSCNNPGTYITLAHFMKLGIDGEAIHRRVYDTYSEDRMRLLGYCLSNKLKVLKEHETAYISLSRQDLKDFNYKDGDTEGVVNYALSIKGVLLAAIFIEKDDLVKISFRSEGNINVNLLAREYFNGGGHKNASGGSSNKSLENTLFDFERIIKNLSVNNFTALKAQG